MEVRMGMHLLEVAFWLELAENAVMDEDAVHSLLGAWRMNGQVIGRELPLAKVLDGYRAFLFAPALGRLGC